MAKMSKAIKVVAIAVLALSLLAVPAALTVQPASAAPRAVAVLFDVSHDDGPMSGYGDMVQDLTAQGYSFTENDGSRITQDKLFRKQILVITQPDHPITATEIAVIQMFITRGGGLLVMSDDIPNKGRRALNSLLQPYGIQQTRKDSRSGIWTKIVSHPTTNGVSQYDQDSSGAGLAVSGRFAKALITGRTHSGRNVVVFAVSEGRGGRVAIISDEYAFSGNLYNNPDNPVLMRNIFNWLSTPPMDDEVPGPPRGPR